MPDGVTLEYVARLPECGAGGVFVSKVPNCPNCGDDELGMVAADRAVCNRCGCIVVRQPARPHILDLPAVCKFCPWTGTVQACEPSDSGDLHCPQCLNEIVIRLAEPESC